MRSFFFVMLAVLALAAGPRADAQAGAAGKDRPLDQLESEIGRLGAPGDRAAPASPEALNKQLAETQASLHRMEKDLAEKSAAIQQLEDENEKLRQALRLRFSGGGNGLPPVPIPNRDLIESVLKAPAVFAERKERAGSSSAPEEYTVVSEWGRSPEVAASLPGKVASLIGLALAVPAGMKEADLKQLGQDLRKNYLAYDNINIEVFDDVESARRFANEAKSDAAHRVMSISKFKHSGRDTFVMYRDGRPVNVP
jgi:hypothetical protein